MSEWLKVLVLKTSGCNSSVGSNPTLTVRLSISNLKDILFRMQILQSYNVYPDVTYLMQFTCT